MKDKNALYNSFNTLNEMQRGFSQELFAEDAVYELKRDSTSRKFPTKQVWAF